MERLGKIFKAMGHTSVKTFIASGNVLFTSEDRNAASLEKAASAHLALQLGYEVDTFIRTHAEVRTIAESEPFTIEGGAQGASVYVTFLEQALPRKTAKRLEAIHTPVDAFRVIGREYYWLCKTRSSESKVWKLPELKALRLPNGTMRNMSTIRKLAVAHLQAGAE